MGSLIQQHCKSIAVILGLFLGYILIRKREKNFSKGQTFLYCTFFSIISVLSSVIFASIERLLSGKGFGFAGVSTYGIYLIAPLFVFALLYFTKHDRRRVFDHFAFYVLPSLFLQRVSCIIAGCCYGISFFHTGSLWPTRELELIFYVLFGVYLYRLEKNGKIAKGNCFPLLMISYGIFRFFEEFVRYSASYHLLHPAHVWSVLCVIIGVSFYYELKKMKRG